MKRSPIRSPYLWAIVLVIALVTAAWMGRHSYKPVLPGAVAPNFTVVDSSGRKVSLSDFKGKVVLVNVWATWCGPCREEMPSIEKLYRHFKDSTGFKILAVSVDARPGHKDPLLGEVGGNPFVFAHQRGYTYPIFWDPTEKIFDLYQMTGVPETFLVGRNGIIYKKIPGATNWAAPANEELVSRLLKG